jgi:hypothetical protein
LEIKESLMNCAHSNDNESSDVSKLDIKVPSSSMEEPLSQNAKTREEM